MKALLISDLHSNVDALEAIWAFEKNVDIVYCAGDVVDVGPNPNEVIEWLKDHNVQCVAGNHDELLVELYDKKQPLANENLNWLEYNSKVITAENVEYLRSLPKNIFFNLDGHDYFMTHLYRIDYSVIQSKFEFSNFAREQNISETTRLIFGHTHKQQLVYFSNNQIMINSGSTGYRSYLEKENKCTKPEYIVIQDGQVVLKSIDYDKRRVRSIISGLQNIMKPYDFDKMMGRVK